MFVCVIRSPSLLSSVPPVSFRHEVTALSVMSVCFHIDRPFCQKQDLDACFRWGKRGIQMVGRKSEEWEGSREKHTQQSYRGKCRVQTQLFLQRAKDYFPWVQEDHPKCVCNIKQPVEALPLHSFWLGSPWRCSSSGHMLLLSLFTPSATADPLDWSQDYRISKS